MRRHRGWASAELAEAALALGDGDRARPAIDDALALFEAAGDRRGVRYAAQLNAYLFLLTDVYPHASPLEGSAAMQQPAFDEPA